MKTFKEFLEENEAYSDDDTYIKKDFTEKINTRSKRNLALNREKKLRKQNTDNNIINKKIEIAKQLFDKFGIKNIEKKELYKVGTNIIGNRDGSAAPFQSNNKDTAVKVANNCFMHHSKEILSPERVQLAADKSNTPSNNFANKDFLLQKDIGENFFIEPTNGAFKLNNCENLNGLDGLARVNNKFYAIEFKNNNDKNEKYGETFINTIKANCPSVIPLYVFGANENNIEDVKKFKEKYKSNVMIGGEFTKWKNNNNCKHIDVKNSLENTIKTTSKYKQIKNIIKPINGSTQGAKQIKESMFNY